MKKSKSQKTIKANPPSATGPAGSEFEGKVGAFYLLSMLTGHEPRGLPGTTIQKVALQRDGEGYPLDDVIVHAHDLSGKSATLEIQVKRSIKFSPQDAVFIKVVKQIAQSANKPEFNDTHYELAIAVAKTTTAIEGSYQDLLTWARKCDADTFTNRFKQEGAANQKMRTFINTFKANLEKADSPSDDETVWKILRRLQIIVFDFTANASVSEELTKERAAAILHPDYSHHSTSLWDSLNTISIDTAANGGSLNRDELVQALHRKNSAFQLGSRRNYATTLKLLRESSQHTLDDIKDNIDGIKLLRTDQLEKIRSAFDSGRYVEIRGGSGVGKSGILKHFAEQAFKESVVIVLSPGRTIPHGWSAMRGQLELEGTAHELLIELASNGAAYLFIDNLDFYDEGQKKTISDLIREAARIAQFRVMITIREGSDVEENNWLPDDALRELGTSPPIIITELSDSEITELKQASTKLAPLLTHNHPAKSITRNLFKLSRLLTLRLDDPVYTEADMVRQWWATADGSSEGRIARSRLLRFLAEQSLLNSGAIDVSSQNETALEALISSETLNHLGNDKVAFYHDVLREWSIAGLLDAEPSKMNRIPLHRLAPPDLKRAVELTASIALRKKDYEAWTHLFNQVTNDATNKSWGHAVLIALLRSGITTEPLEAHLSFLLSNEGEVLSKLIRIVMAVEVTPARNAAALIKEDTPELPEAFIDSWNLPNPQTFYQLMMWIHSKIHQQALPAALIPDVTNLYLIWCNGMLGQANSLVIISAQQFYDWLKEIEDAEDASIEAYVEPFEGHFDSRALNSLKEKLRLSFFTYANRQPTLAAEYLNSIKGRKFSDEIIRDLLKYHGSLAQAAPEQLADFIIDTLIPKPLSEEEYGYHSHSDQREPFNQSYEISFHPPSANQKIFLDLLIHSEKQGLKVIQQLTSHVINFDTAGTSKESNDDGFMIPFSEGERFFPWRQTYFWAREYRGGCKCVTAGLMALKQWAKILIERGESIDSVFSKIIGTTSQPAAYLLIIADLIIEHWPKTMHAAVPFLACPELLSLDRTNIASDVLGQAGRKLPNKSLNDLIDRYIRPDVSELRERIIIDLKHASKRLGSPPELSDLRHPAFMAAHLLNRLDLNNREEITILSEDGTPLNDWNYVHPENERKHLQRLTASQAENNISSFMSLIVTSAVEREERLSNEELMQAVDWCQDNTIAPNDNENWLPVVSAAMLLMRDGQSDLKLKHLEWAKSVFSKTPGCTVDDVHRHREGLMFNPKAIAFCGLAYLQEHHANKEVIRHLLDLASDSDPAAAHGFISVVNILHAIDERLLRSIVRCGFQASIKPDKNWDSPEEVYHQQLEQYVSQNKKTVTAELEWLAGDISEPPWPVFPELTPRVKRPIYVGQTFQPEETEIRKDKRIDYDAAALWLKALNSLENNPSSTRLLDILNTFQDWTMSANGVGIQNPERNIHLMDWNSAYFELLANCVTQIDLDAIDPYLMTVVSLPDEQFFEVIPVFLNTIDKLYFEDRIISGSIALRIRELLAKRFIATKQWERQKNSQEDCIGLEAQSAIGFLFFNYYGALGSSHYYLEAGHNKLITNFLPILSRTIQDCPLTITALFSLNLLECEPSPDHYEFCLQITETWLLSYQDSVQFWVEYGVGLRLCIWLQKVITMKTDLLSNSSSRALIEKLTGFLLSMGISEATALELLVAN